MRGPRLIGAAIVVVLSACSGAAPAASSSASATGPTFSVANGTSIPVAIAVNGTVIETVPAGVWEDPIHAAVPPRPWVVEARSPTGRVLATMTVGPNDSLSATSGRLGMEDLACGRLAIWAGAPLGGGPTFIPDPSKPCD